MNKTKIDFLADILASNKLDTVNKERFLSLAAEEMKKNGFSETTILERIAELENKIINLFKQKNEPKGEDTEIFVHTPQITSKHLSLFKNGNKLKWITHIYPNTDEMSFDYDRITKDAESEFNTIAKELPKNLMGVISLFLKPRKNKPNEKHITYLGDKYETWWSPKIIDWCKNNQGLHPDTDDNLSNKIIIPFKKSIEIRDGNDLELAIKHKLVKTFGNRIFNELDIDFSGIKKSTRFFTGVDQVITGIAKLFSPIIKRKLISKRVIISTKIEELNEQFVTILKITHQNSNSESDYNDENIIHGDLKTAKDFFTSFCDWRIIANYSNGTYEFNPLSVTSSGKISKLNSGVDGFTHNLIFY